jgi:purine nucleosidase
VLAGIGAATAQPAREPTRIIFDTDMFGDIDDVMALAMLHALQSRGEAQLLAVTISTDYAWCAPFVDAVDTYYGHGGVPIGVVTGGVTGDATWKKFPPAKMLANYTRYISELRRPGGSLQFPHKVGPDTRLPEALVLLRKTLAGEPDNSVTIIQVGFSTNLARLLASKADAASPLSGMELVRHKVKLLSVMAGAYADRNGQLQAHSQPEFNLMLDVPAAQALFAQWPTPIVDSGFEIGDSMLFKGADIDAKFSAPKTNPVVETYRYTDPLFRAAAAPVGKLHDHPTYDLTAVLYAVRPDDGYFSLSRPGTIAILADGSSRFAASEGGTRRYLTLTPVQRARALEAMTSLVSQPQAIGGIVN